jgi:hypothetical protein
MKSTKWWASLSCVLLLTATFAVGDSIALRNGRHLQGKYIGGTPTSIGFMSGSTVEYFATFDVVALLFDGGPEATGVQPRPMIGPDHLVKSQRSGSLRRTRVANRNVAPTSIRKISRPLL